MKRILSDVYRNSANGIDTTNNGVTSKNSILYLYYECDRGEAIDDCKTRGIDPNICLLLVTRDLGGEPAWYAEPLVKRNEMQMFGGNFIYASDSRFPSPTKYKRPIPVHDRYETTDEYLGMSI